MAYLNIPEWGWAFVMPLQLSNEPCSSFTWHDVNLVLVYLDDVVVLGKTFEDCLQNFKDALLRFQKYNLKFKPKKCQLFQQEVEFLGTLVSSDGIKIAPSKAEAVQKWPVPTTRKELMSFLRFVNYHRDHVPNFACLTACLYELAYQQRHREWKPEHDEAFLLPVWRIQTLWISSSWTRMLRITLSVECCLNCKMAGRLSYAMPVMYC
jgi:hypothetical protein